jgi:hypothetical protein
LLETAQRMEVGHPVGPGAITEFDRLFEIGCVAVTQCLAASSADWSGKKSRKKQPDDKPLVDVLEQITEVFLRCWLRHSHGVRLSVLETVADPERWRLLKQFIERYGGDLFNQSFMNLGNLRGILHQGVDNYLETLADEPDAAETHRLLAELDSAIAFDEAVHWLGIAIEAVAENYGEYIDYNSITTQSDRGEMLYTLLDFLRLQASYDRLAWNLRPVVLAHQVLVRRGCDRAAETWRNAVAERTGPIAAEHLLRFEQLCQKYAMRLPSIAEHLGERFIRPLEIDQLCALLRPAVEEIRAGHPSTAVEQLESWIAGFTCEPAGAGFETPGWIEAIEEELDHLSLQSGEAEQESLDPLIRLPQTRLTQSEVRKQIQQML